MDNVTAGILASQLEASFEGIGCSMMKDEFAAKLLAFLYVMGGGNEAVTFNTDLVAGIHIAQKKFNMYGSEYATPDGITLIKKYVKELEKERGKCEWLDEIEKRYDIQISRYEIFSED